MFPILVDTEAHLCEAGESLPKGGSVSDRERIGAALPGQPCPDHLWCRSGDPHGE